MFHTYYLSTFITLFLVSLLGFFSNKKVKSSEDFAVGSRKLNSIKISGSIIATLVGGASTIGTAQLAFQRGFNAMWFTLGASVACIFLGLFMAGPLRRAEVDTVSQFLSRSYGEKIGIFVSIITSLAIFIHVVGQILSSVAILTSMFDIGILISVIVTVGLIISYIFFGGFLGTSVVGTIKTILLYFVLFISATIIYKGFGGISGLSLSFPREPWFNLFSEGVSSGLAQGFSMVVGVVSTQTYLQAMFAGKSEIQSRRGAFISAFLIPPVGFICTLIGMYMKNINPNLIPKEALPYFIINYLNPWVGGIAIAALVISVVGTGAGLVLGISTMINRDIYLRFINSSADDIKQLRVLRASVFAISITAMIMVLTNVNSLILKWGFLSMSLRGTTIFIPLLCAMYLKDTINSQAILASVIISPICTILWEVFGGGIDSLYIGILTSVLIITVTFLYNKNISKTEKH